MELKQLDEMGDLRSLQKPEFLLESLVSHDLSSQDVILTLNDIYQFLQYENEFEVTCSFLIVFRIHKILRFQSQNMID